MAFQQQRIAQRESPTAVTPEVARAAARYQRDREVEALQLAVMAGHNLGGEWTAEARAAVLEAREHVRAARETRAVFRGAIRDHVRALRSTHEALPTILRRTRTMVQLLQSTGAIEDDGGWLEAEVLEWAIEEFELVD